MGRPVTAFAALALALALVGCGAQQGPARAAPEPQTATAASPGPGPRAARASWGRLARYDDHFQAAAGRFWRGLPLDWLWLWAQGMAESGLDPDAISPVGARGLMQIMPATARELAEQTGLPARVNDPRTAAMLAAFYMRRLYLMWNSPRPHLDRVALALACYNAGAGNILKAQKAARAVGWCSDLWECVARALPRVTGRHSRETTGYVARINKFYMERKR